MKAAADALVVLDTAKALNEIDKVEPRWLTASQRDELEELRTQTDHAIAERRELEERTAAVLREHLPDRPPKPTRASPGTNLSCTPRGLPRFHSGGHHGLGVVGNPARHLR